MYVPGGRGRGGGPCTMMSLFRDDWSETVGTTALLLPFLQPPGD